MDLESPVLVRELVKWLGVRDFVTMRVNRAMCEVIPAFLQNIENLPPGRRVYQFLLLSRGVLCVHCATRPVFPLSLACDTCTQRSGFDDLPLGHQHVIWLQCHLPPELVAWKLNKKRNVAEGEFYSAHYAALAAVEFGTKYLFDGNAKKARAVMLRPKYSDAIDYVLCRALDTDEAIRDIREHLNMKYSLPVSTFHVFGTFHAHLDTLFGRTDHFIRDSSYDAVMRAERERFRRVAVKYITPTAARAPALAGGLGRSSTLHGNNKDSSRRDTGASGDGSRSKRPRVACIPHT